MWMNKDSGNFDNLIIHKQEMKILIRKYKKKENHKLKGKILTNWKCQVRKPVCTWDKCLSPAPLVCWLFTARRSDLVEDPRRFLIGICKLLGTSASNGIRLQLFSQRLSSPEQSRDTISNCLKIQASEIHNFAVDYACREFRYIGCPYVRTSVHRNVQAG